LTTLRTRGNRYIKMELTNALRVALCAAGLLWCG
jgi:hypothetical protein